MCLWNAATGELWNTQMKEESKQEEAEAVEEEEEEERKSLVSSTHLSCSEYSATLGKAAVAACFLPDHKRLGLPLCCHGYTIPSRSAATVSVTVTLTELQTVTHTAIDANPHLPPPTHREKYNRGEKVRIKSRTVHRCLHKQLHYSSCTGPRTLRALINGFFIWMWFLICVAIHHLCREEPTKVVTVPGLLERNVSFVPHLVEMELLLLELLFVLLQELLVLLLDHQLLQGQGLGVGLGCAPLWQRGRLGSAEGPVLPLQLGHGCSRRHRQAADTCRHRQGWL